MHIQPVILLCHEVRHLFQGQAVDHFSGVFIQLVEIIVLCGKAIATEDHVPFHEKIHAVVGLVGAPPQQLLIFQIIGKHKAGVRLGIAVHYRSPIEDPVLKAGVITIDVPFVCRIFQYIQAVLAVKNTEFPIVPLIGVILIIEAVPVHTDHGKRNVFQSTVPFVCKSNIVIRLGKDFQGIGLRRRSFRMKFRYSGEIYRNFFRCNGCFPEF